MLAMVLEYEPPNLKHFLESESGQRRLKNREGWVIAFNPDKTPTDLALEGPLLTMHRLAVQYEGEHPDQVVVVHQNNCGHTGLPDALLFGLTLTSLI